MGSHVRTTAPGRAWGVCAFLAVGLVLAACVPPGAPGSAPSSTTAAPAADEPFTVVLIADSETRSRGNTAEELSIYIEHLTSYRGDTVEHFDHEGGTHRVDPELVILAGDISADRDTSVAADMPLWSTLYDHGIAFIAGAGNHDWEPVTFADGTAGYSVAGHLSNESTTGFVRETYRRSAQVSDGFTWSEIGPTAVHGPSAFHARYRGVEIVNFNTFLYQPSYRYPDGWPVTCNLLTGGAGCQIFVDATPQIDRVADRLDPASFPTALFTQHYPLTTSDNWWNDHGVSGTTLQERKLRLLGLMAQYDDSALLAGHNHSELVQTHLHDGRTITEYVAPYFGGAGGDDLTRGGGAVALLVSPSEGILEHRRLRGPFGG